MIKYIMTQDATDCCGCRACEQICAHNALSMVEDEEGFFYPFLDEEACRDCGLCEKVCPMTYGNSLLYGIGKPVAAQNLNKKDLFTSSSGGAFVAIAKEILAEGGVVYGAAFEEGSTLRHQRVITLEGLEKLKGSKYLQSDTKDVYSQVKHDLLSGRKVYFVGTPCQVAGLRLFLRKDYETLVTSDFICHGTPSNKIFRNTISQIEKKICGKFKNYSFRDKNIRGWSCSSSSLWGKGDKEVYYIYSIDMEAYFNAFISGDIMRMNCYQCPYARPERCGDITIADYWDVRQKNPDFPSIGKGVSLILLNSEKGKVFFQRIASQFYFIDIPMENAVSNRNLKEPTPLSEERKNSYSLAFSDYKKFVRKYYQGNYFINNVRIHAEYYLRHSGWLFPFLSFLKRKLK